MKDLAEIRWEAVLTRQRSQDGVFVYAVRTTGIFCRPGCGARRPRRENVEFFASPADATAAGYRPCRRCRPEEDRVADPVTRAVIAACRRLERPDGEPRVADMAKELGWSERHLRRMFAEVTGVSIGGYRRAAQAERAREALRAGMPATDAMYEAGYGSARAFYEHGAPRLGMALASYRSGGRGETITYTVLATTIGTAVVAATARGVAAVRLGDDAPSLVTELGHEFPCADLRRDDPAMAGIASVIAGAVRGEADAAVLPTDLAATAFQARVWEALRQIPRGETRSYSEVARAIGAPAAARAVARACAANPAAIVVPCHRVVRRDGSLGGYRWGMARKRALLDAESRP